jgi:hypothetical protein
MLLDLFQTMYVCVLMIMYGILPANNAYIFVIQTLIFQVVSSISV